MPPVLAETRIRAGNRADHPAGLCRSSCASVSTALGRRADACRRAGAHRELCGGSTCGDGAVSWRGGKSPGYPESEYSRVSGGRGRRATGSRDPRKIPEAVKVVVFKNFQNDCGRARLFREPQAAPHCVDQEGSYEVVSPGRLPVPGRPGYGLRARQALGHVASASVRVQHGKQVRPAFRSPTRQGRPWRSPSTPGPCLPWSGRRERTSERYRWTSCRRKRPCGHAVPCPT